jgi:uncharacterized protein (DUF1499 family)
MPAILSRAAMILERLLLGVAAVVVLAFAAGQFGLLRGHPPADLGVHEGRLKAPAATPNSVSSQADLWPGAPQRDHARIAPLPAVGSAEATMARLQAIVTAMPRTRIVAAQDDYLRAEFTTRWMKFTDDVEFWFDRGAGVVQVRSASRLGEGDHGVNRARVEAIRAALAASAAGT